jgi:hypothetical protein
LPQNGGIIGSVTANANCGELSFTVPGDLVVLEEFNAPCAPDYGFKIKLLSAGWNHGIVGYWPDARPVVNPFAISGDGTQIVYRGADGSLNCYYRAANSSHWDNAVIGPSGSRGVKPNGSIFRGRTSNQVYYHGADDRLQAVYWDGSGWLHAYLADWGTTAQNVGGGIGSKAGGGDIFYRGADGSLHTYFFWGGSWHHSVFYLAAGKRPSKDTNIAVNDDGSLVAFGAIDGTLVLVYKILGSGTYESLHTSELVGGMVRVSSCGNSIFYRDSAGRLHQYYHNGTGWNSRVILAYGGPVFFDGPFDIAPGCDYNNFQVYFRGPDGYVHVAFLWAGSYISGKLMVCIEPTKHKCLEGGYIAVGGTTVAYEAVLEGRGARPFLQAYYHGMCGSQL